MSAPHLLRAFDLWLSGQKAQGNLRHATSAAVYRAMWQALASWCLAQKPPVPLRALDAGLLQRYLDSRSGMAGPAEPLSPRYQSRLLALVQRVQTDHALRSQQAPQGAAQELLRRSPALREAGRAAATELPLCLSDAEAHQLQQWLLGIPGTTGMPVLPTDAAIPPTDGPAPAAGTHTQPVATPAPAADLPRARRRGRRPVTDPHAWQALRDRAAAGLQLGAGLGPGELRALRVDSVSLLGGRTTPLPWRLQVPANGSAPAHQVPVSGWPAVLLGQWLQRRQDEGIPGPWLFPSARSGKPWGKVAQFQAGRRVLAEAGLQADAAGGSFRLRHTFAVRQLQQGVSPDELARRLGVVDLSVIERYQRLLDERAVHAQAI